MLEIRPPFRLISYWTRLQTGRVEQHILPNQHASIDIQDRHWRYQLQKHSKPNWANRIWRDTHGLFAAHEAGLIMQLSEANPDRPQAQWEIVEQPWQCADRVGVDEKGL